MEKHLYTVRFFQHLSEAIDHIEQLKEKKIENLILSWWHNVINNVSEPQKVHTFLETHFDLCYLQPPPSNILSLLQTWDSDLQSFQSTQQGLHWRPARGKSDLKKKKKKERPVWEHLGWRTAKCPKKAEQGKTEKWVSPQPQLSRRSRRNSWTSRKRLTRGFVCFYRLL